jgi:tetratricopeptide (TPR) repeat protein
MASSELAAPSFSSSRQHLLMICLALLAGVLAVYGQTCSQDFAFLNLDDNEYVTDNPHVRGGITLDNVKWALTALHSYNWHPLTWMSLQLDAQLYGMAPAGFHATNVLLHAANTVLLFWLLQRLTGAVWCSAVVAFFFGVHPAHVESVAWVTERKDVLSTLFWLLTMAAYAWYAARPGLGRYLVVAFTFGLGLLAKPMVVTLPAVLVLLDVWPLRRWPRDTSVSSPFAPASVGRLVLEKLPLFLLAAAAIFLTLQAQRQAVFTLEQIPLSVRVANALVAYIKYIFLLVWPSGLAIYYPHPGAFIPRWQPVLAALLLAALTGAAIWQWQRRPYLAVGWLWYVGTMVPVIGLVQVGSHALADRYTYVPSIGLSILLVWGVAELASRWHVPRPALISLVGGALAVYLVLAWRQVGYWRDSETLWRHALAVTRDNALAREMLATALMRQPGKLPEARDQLRRALQLERLSPWAHANLAVVLEQLGELDEAARHYQLAMNTGTDIATAQEAKQKALFGLGRVRERQGRFREAQKHYAALVEINPTHVDAQIGLGGVLEEQGLFAEAQRHYEAALRLEPNSPLILNHLGRVLQRQNKPWEALASFDRALAIQPESADTWNNKGVALEQVGRLEEARQCYQRAVEQNPDQSLFRCNLAYVLAESGLSSEAQEQYDAASRLYPAWRRAALQQAWNLATSPEPRQRNGRQALRIAKQVCQAIDYQAPQGLDVLAAAYAELGQFEAAAKWQRKALSLLASDLNAEIRKGVEQRLQLYESHKPYRQPLAAARP